MTQTVSLTTAFIDLSTYDEIESFLYGGRSINKFRKVIRRSAWFTVIAAQLNKLGTCGDFETEMQAMFSRAGDYVRDCWLRVEVPKIESKPGYQARWCKKLGHNLIEEAYLHFNDLTVNKITSYHMDFMSAFMGIPGKQEAYSAMIGHVEQMYNPHAYYKGIIGKSNNPNDPDDPAARAIGAPLPAAVLNIPLPFYFCRDPADSIVQAACPFNDIKVTIKFRAWRDLLMVDKLVGARGATAGYAVKMIRDPDFVTQLQTSLSNIRLQKCEVWAHYAVIPNGDREKISEEQDIDTIVEQYHHIPPVNFNAGSERSKGVDLRFSSSVRALFFALRNSGIKNDWSNYGTHVLRPSYDQQGINYGYQHENPIQRAVLTYENVDRVNMYGDYFTQVAPYYTASTVPMDPGYHMLPYCNNLGVLQPDGSTNFARLASVNLNVEASEQAQIQASAKVDPNPQAAAELPEWDTSKVAYQAFDAALEVEQWTGKSQYDIIITASSLSILRMSSGSAGFPVL